ncbi:MAG: hypothetical protein H7Z38_23200 [Rubrivivax sp.]|nr:hypothetical protein [Pyrinomonadaceae bacterium]
MKELEYWLEWKTSRKFSLKEPVTVTGEYKRAACHGMYGKVVLSAKPAASFSFRPVAIWPSESYENAVLRGILDILLASDFNSVLGAEFVLEEIDWHEVDSCEFGYYQAARTATEEIIKNGGIEHSG